MTNYRVVNTDDGGILCETGSLKAAKTELKGFIAYCKRHGQATGTLRVKRYIGDGEWATVKVDTFDGLQDD